MIQTMEVADEDKFDFEPLDDTKTWPEDSCMVLNTEQRLVTLLAYQVGAFACKPGQAA